MRKVEAVHLHALLREIRRHAESRGRVSPDAFTVYDRRGLSPLQIHRRKAEHEEALTMLAATLAAELATDSKGTPDGKRSSELAASGPEDG